MTPAELLALTGRLAPLLRGKRPRKVNVVDATGKVVRAVNDAEVAEKLLERHGIEVSLSAEAEKLFRESHCSGCDKELKGRGKTGMCRSCATKKAMAERSPEERRAIARKSNETLGADGRKRRTLKAWAGLTPEARHDRTFRPKEDWRELGRIGNARLGKKALQEHGRKISARMTPEQRAERARKIWESRRKANAGPA